VGIRHLDNQITDSIGARLIILPFKMRPGNEDS